MKFQFLRRTLIPANLINPSNFLYFSTLVTQIKKPSSKITDYLITRHNFSQETASNISISLTRLKDYKRSDFVIDFFKKIGLSSTQLEILVSCQPRVLVADVNKRIKVTVLKIRELGFSNDELGDLLCAVPEILTLPRSVDGIISAVSVLQSIVGSNSDVIRAFKASNWFLSSDMDKVLLPNIELLEKCGVSKMQIRQMLFSFPRFFLLKHEDMKECVRRVDEMGLGRDSKMYVYGVRVMSAMTLENWESKLKLFKTLGFSDDDILSVFRRVPQAFAVSERKILMISKLLLSSERVEISYLVQHAELLVYSATARIKPRLDIISVLLSKSLIKEPSMTTLIKVDDERFIRSYVLPYAGEIGEAGEKYLVSKGLKAP